MILPGWVTPCLKITTGVLSKIWKWIEQPCVHSTSIKIFPPDGDDEVIVQLYKPGEGILNFGITSDKEEIDVEIIRIEVYFDDPLELRDPDNRGFFRSEPSTKADYCQATIKNKISDN